MGSGAISGHRRVAPISSVPKINVQELVASPRPRAFPASSSSDAPAGLPTPRGDCLLFLEQIKQAGGGHPFLRARVERTEQYVDLPGSLAEGEEGGDAPCCVRQWPAKPCEEVASYFSARSLRLPMASRDKYTLHLEVWDQKTKLARLALPLAEIPAHVVVEREMESLPSARTFFKSSKSPISISISFQIVDSVVVAHRRTVFFVRHAESLWNEAQSKKHYHKMVQDTDHGLSVRGRQQAEELCQKLQGIAVGRESDVRAAPMLNPDAVWVSPLTRAVQTAVIGIGHTLTESEGLGKILLSANAREKRNLGGMDTCSTKTGVDILESALDRLRLLYRGCGQQSEDLLDTFAKLRFDVREVESQWWCEGQFESHDTFQSRLEELMAQLLYSPHRSIVVVGHSHLFRAFFGKYISEGFKQRERAFAQSMSEQKLSNCGVVRVELDPKMDVDGQPIVEAEAVFGHWVS